MKLIIAEKPALVSAIADALDGPRKSLQGSTYMTVGDYTLISVFGHLLELKEPEDYDECYKDRKNISLLPIYFDDWGLKVKEPDAKHKDSPPEERLNEIGRLLKQCEYVIHAGDPDEEGQLLIDEVLRWFHYKGKAYRLDTLDLTEAGMRRALRSLTDNRLHENSGWSAYARSVADAIVGFNLSRYFSALNGVNLPVGRVQTATLGLVCARDEQIESHKKTLYYDVTAVLDVNGVRIDTQYAPAKDDANLTDGRMLSRTYAQSRADMLKDETLNGVTVTRKTVSEDAPLPFNLGKLTSFCGSKFGYKPQEVMEITQSLREKYKAISYNRTDCQYLTETQYTESGPTMDAVIRNIGFRPKQLDMTLKSKCFNDKYTTDSGEAHTAIIPQNISVDIHAMTEPERKVYLAICQYYMAQFMPPAKKERSALTVKLKDGGTLSASASKIIEMGYLTLFKKDGIRNEESALCAVPVGTYQCDVLDASVVEKETKPPVRYTQNTLVADMSSCILSEPVDVSKYGIIYGGVQKNIGPAGVVIVIAREDLITDDVLPGTPTMLKWKTQADKDSLYNTPPCYGIYICGKVFKWLKKMGGLEEMQRRNIEKAKILYDFLDESKLFKGTVRKEDRSLMNVPFVTGDKDMDAKFVKEATEAGFVNLKGHRTVGGMRASIYNAMPKEGVEKLVAFMKKFEKENA